MVKKELTVEELRKVLIAGLADLQTLLEAASGGVKVSEDDGEQEDTSDSDEEEPSDDEETSDDSETEEESGDSDGEDNEEEPEDQTETVVKAFADYAKKNGRAKALKHLKALKVKSVREIPASKHAAVLKMLKGKK